MKKNKIWKRPKTKIQTQTKKSQSGRTHLLLSLFHTPYFHILFFLEYYSFHIRITGIVHVEHFLHVAHSLKHIRGQMRHLWRLRLHARCRRTTKVTFILTGGMSMGMMLSNPFLLIHLQWLWPLGCGILVSQLLHCLVMESIIHPCNVLVVVVTDIGMVFVPLHALVQFNLTLEF